MKPVLRKAVSLTGLIYPRRLNRHKLTGVQHRLKVYLRGLQVLRLCRHIQAQGRLRANDQYDSG